MEKLKSLVAGARSGLSLILRGTVYGILVGSITTLLLPTVVSVRPRLAQTIRGFHATKFGHSFDPWLTVFVAPAHIALILFILILTVGYLTRESIQQFLERCYTWSIYEPTLLWATYSFFILTLPFWWALIAFIVAIAVTCLIAWHRTPHLGKTEALISSDITPAFLNIQQAASYFGVTTWTIRRLIENKELACAKIGKRFIIKREDLDEDLDNVWEKKVEAA
jgi:excisionase family DNA binding protein